MSEQAQNAEIRQPENTAKPRKKSKIRRFFKWLFICVGVLLLVLSITLYYLLATHSGLRTLVFRLPEKAGVTVKADNLQGTVWRGFSAGNITVTNPHGLDIALTSLKFNWQSNQLFKKHLHINQLQLGKLYLNSFPPADDKPKDDTPLQLPNNVSLPLKISVDKLSTDGVFLKETVLVKNAEISYYYDHKQHTAHITQLGTEWGTAQGNALLDNKTPFALNGKIDLQGTVNQEPAIGSINLSGSLKDIVLQSQLTSANALFDIDGQVSPFNNNVVEKNTPFYRACRKYQSTRFLAFCSYCPNDAVFKYCPQCQSYAFGRRNRYGKRKTASGGCERHSVFYR
ncbi:MAG: hypothetical protein IJ780_04100 [Neisseriaceae bacterium]|nr:hypothetical protein [Neisseriaceae bacterium]